MMKRLMLVLALFTAAVLSSVKAEAGYKYRVTIEAGLHGTVNGGSTYEAEQFDYNQQWNPNNYQDMIAVSDPKYYFKGFHISGIEGVVGTQYITKDTVFVATYGIKGQTVAYTVEYVDNNGVTPTYVGDLPLQLAAMNSSNIYPQLLTIEAAYTGRKETLYQAALMEPHTGAQLSTDEIVSLCNELIEAHTSAGYPIF